MVLMASENPIPKPIHSLVRGRLLSAKQRLHLRTKQRLQDIIMSVGGAITSIPLVRKGSSTACSFALLHGTRN